MTLAFALGLGLSIIALFSGIALARRDSGMQARLVRYAKPAVTLEEMELRMPIGERLFLPFFRRILDMLYRLTPGAQVSQTRQNMMKAGLLGQMSVAQFELRRFSVAFVLGGGAAFYAGFIGMPIATSLSLGLPLAALGYMLPSIWLGSSMRKRQEMIQRQLPDAIDLLTVCVEAGLGFDAALARVIGKWKGPLSEEFERLLADLRMGRVRREALKALADRTDVSDIQSFVSALVQADLLGVGLVKVLRVQSDQMRQRRRLRAEEQAQKAPVKMLFPLIFMIFPAVYIIVLGPAALTLAKAFGGG